MISYILRRLFGLIPVFLGITLITFAVIHLAPGKVTEQSMELKVKVSLEARERLERLYNLDKPIHVQYMLWLRRFLFFDFGESFVDNRPVIEKIMERLPVTISINILSMLFILLVAIPLGVASAVRRGSLFDKASTVFVFVGFAVPSFWLALLLISLLGVQWGWLPVTGLKSLDFENLTFIQKFFDISRHLILPIFVSAFGGLAGISRYMRQSMINVMHEDYIRTARAKGLSEKDVIYKHAMRNGLLPIVTILGLSIPGLIGGSVIFESVFGIPGMGQLFYQSVMSRDLATVMAVLVIGSILTLLANLAADIAYFYIDPRIRFDERR